MLKHFRHLALEKKMKYFFCDKNLTNLAAFVVDDVVVAVVVTVGVAGILSQIIRSHSLRKKVRHFQFMNHTIVQ